jgi:Plavaka transposase
MHGALFVPVILGSDKTTVSVATGQNDFYPLYISIGNIHNSVRRAHRDGVSILGFLCVPTSEHTNYSLYLSVLTVSFQADRKYQDDDEFRMFRRQLFHSSLGAILKSLQPAMSIPEVTRCPDGHFRRVIYGIGPYIADYPEQVLLASVVSGWCPK